MNRLGLCAVVATLAATVVPASASPLPTGPVGRVCELTQVPDLYVDDGWQGGDLRAGPLYTAEPGTLVCSVHVNNNSHNGAAYASASFPAANGVVFGTAPVVYQATDADSVSLCATWYGASGTLYWHAPNPAIPTDSGAWNSGPSSCGELLSVEPIVRLPPLGAGPQCADGVDNDGDGRRDYPADPDCANALGSESPPEPS